MKNTRRIKRAILVSIVSALCFSAGEGLRLLPIPGLAVEKIQQADPSTFEALPIKYGPVDQPQSVFGKIKTKLSRLHCVTGTAVDISHADFTQSIEIAAFTTTPAREPYSPSMGRAPPSLDS